MSSSKDTTEKNVRGSVKRKAVKKRKLDEYDSDLEDKVKVIIIYFYRYLI